MISTDGAAGQRALELARGLRDRIDRDLHARVNQFANDPEQCFLDESEGFPVRDRLAGTYYIGSESYKGAEDTASFPWRISIQVRCLEKPWHPNQEASGYDYLGLEAIVDIAADGASFEFDDGFHTSSI